MSAPSTFTRFLGATFVHRYEETALTIGNQRISRYDLVHTLDCAATRKAAGILQTALDSLGIRTTTQALALNPVDLAAIPGVGVTAVYVFLCWQRIERGSVRAVEAWYAPDGVTLSTLKRRVTRRKTREREPKKKTGLSVVSRVA